jgi:hypothetical protein
MKTLLILLMLTASPALADGTRPDDCKWCTTCGWCYDHGYRDDNGYIAPPVYTDDRYYHRHRHKRYNRAPRQGAWTDGRAQSRPIFRQHCWWVNHQYRVCQQY